MRILHYTQEFVPATQTFVYDQVEQSGKAGFETRICTRRILPGNAELVQHITRTGNFNFIKPGLLRYLFAGPSLYYPALGLEKWDQFLREFSPDVIHCHFAWSLIDILPVLQYLEYSCPVLVSLHGTDVMVYPRWVKGVRALITAFAGPLHFTVPSRYLEQQACKNLSIKKESISLLPNMLNPAFLSGRKASFKYGDELKIINIGRFVPVKGHRYLLEAFVKLVREHYQNARLILVGSGRELPGINKQIRRSGLQSQVDIIPELRHDRVPDLLAECHIYVQPSIHNPGTGQGEAFGLAVAEAIGVGLPVVVTNSGGLPETVLSGHTDCAIIVREKDPADLVRGLQRILDNSCHQDPEYRQMVVDAYHPDMHIQNLGEIYRHVATMQNS